MQKYAFMHFTFLAHYMFCVNWSFYLYYLSLLSEKLKIFNLPKGHTTDFNSALRTMQRQKQWRNTQLCCLWSLAYIQLFAISFVLGREVPHIHMPRSSRQFSCTEEPCGKLDISRTAKLQNPPLPIIPEARASEEYAVSSWHFSLWRKRSAG